MPTLQQLPLVAATSPTDRIPVEQNGQTNAVSVDTLLAPTQAKIALASGTLLGRVSAGFGSPEVVGVGSGLAINDGVLTTANAAPAIVVPGTYTKVTVNAAGQVTSGALLGASDVVGLDVSGSTVTVSSGPARSLVTRATDRLNVLDFGAVADGVTSAGAAISSAVTAAAALPMGGEVYLPAGRYRIDMVASAILVSSNVLLRGAGRGKTVLYIDDSTGSYQPGGIVNVGPGGTRPAISNFHLRDVTLLGMRDLAGQNVTSGPFLVSLQNVNNISVEDCEFLNSRGFSLGIFSGSDVLVRGNRVINSNIDSIAVWDVSNVIITDNQIEMSGDDSISVHTNDATTAPLRSGVVISNNTISDGPGIKVLGAKTATISGNIVRRGRQNGIRVAFDPYFLQGDTSNFAVQIVNNLIEDVIDPSGFIPGSTKAQYILIGGSSKQTGTGISPPGTPAPASGVVVPLYGSTTGNFYANAQSNNDGSHVVVGTTPSPGGYWLRVEGNTLVRTLPAVTTWSQWGYGTALQVGQAGSYNGAITEAMLNHAGIHIRAALCNSRIAGNIIQTTGANSMEFDTVVSDMDYNGLEIVDNKLADFSQFGIFWPTSTVSNHRIQISRNYFDGDPYFKSSARAANGTWTSSGATVLGLNLSYLGGVEVEGNHFRNVSQGVLLSASAFNVLRRNVIHCNPASIGFNASNQGVGTVPPAGDDFTHVIEICDPTNSSFGELESPTLATSSSQPVSGTYVTGHLVTTSQPTVVNGQAFLGWMRLTTGKNHITGTDWTPIFGASGGPVPTAALLGGNGTTLTGVGIGGGLVLSGAVLSASAAPMLSVTTLYSTSGTISPTDTVSLVNATGAVSVALAAGSTDGHVLIVKRYGAGTVTLTANIDGSVASSIVMSSTSLKEAVSLAWSQSLGTWLMI